MHLYLPRELPVPRPGTLSSSSWSTCPMLTGFHSFLSVQEKFLPRKFLSRLRILNLNREMKEFCKSSRKLSNFEETKLFKLKQKERNLSSRILGLEQHLDEEFFPPTLIPVLYPLQLCPCSCSTGYWTTSWTSSWTSPGTSPSTSWTSLLTLYWRLSQPNLASRFNVNSFVSNRYYFCRHSYAETCLNVSYEEIIFITMSINVICNCHRRDDVMKPSKTLSR